MINTMKHSVADENQGLNSLLTLVYLVVHSLLLSPQLIYDLWFLSEQYITFITIYRIKAWFFRKYHITLELPELSPTFKLGIPLLPNCSSLGEKLSPSDLERTLVSLCKCIVWFNMTIVKQGGHFQSLLKGSCTCRLLSTLVNPN